MLEKMVDTDYAREKGPNASQCIIESDRLKVRGRF